MRTTISMLCCTLAAAVPAVPAAAENLILDEIVVRGQKESPREESLTIREVRESPARDMGEALRQVEGLSYVRKGAIANDVVIRGLQRDNINVLIDGVRLYGACPNRMDSPAFHFDFAEVEQIRIVKGPYDVENAGSLGGLVDAVGKKPKKGFGSDLSFTYGSYDSVNASGTASYGTDRIDGLLGYAYKYSKPPESGDGKRITEIYPATSNNRYRLGSIDSTAYEINTGWARFGINPTDNSRTEFSYSYQDADHVLYPYLLMDADYDRTHRFNWSYRIEKLSPLVSEVKLQAYWNRVKHLMDDRYRETSNPDNAALMYRTFLMRNYFMSTLAETETWGAKLNSSLAVGPGTLKAGIDYYNRGWDATNTMLMRSGTDWIYGDSPMIPDVTIHNTGMFLEYTLPLAERLKLTAAARGDLTRAEADRLAAGRIATLYQPYYPGRALSADTDFGEASGNLQLTWTPITGLELFAGFGRGIRTPDPQELYTGLQRMGSNWVGNPLLEPTVNNQGDVGVKYATDSYYVNASFFYGYLHNYINVTDLPDPDGAGPLLRARSYRNVNATLWGGEFGSQFSLPANFFLKASLSYTRGNNESDDRPLSEIPPLRGTMALRYDVDSWFLEVAENFADRQDRVDAALQEQETAGWFTTDLKGGVTYGGLSVYAGVNNLFDKYYFSHLSYQRDPFSTGAKVPENGRNYYLTLAYRF
ncbi:TonB-dependent receptor domain-containing protein [Geobacter anodireducens]